MNLGDLKQSKFLKKDDVGRGVLVTIASIKLENVALEGAPEDHKAIVYFRELEKGLVLNSTNGQIIAKITGVEDDIEHAWLGARIVLYNDPNISFKGQLTGGIRVRAPKKVAVEPPPPPEPEDIIEDDQLPF